jgi:hypothetical protein
LSGRILAGFLVVLLMMVAGAAEPTRVVQAEEIRKKIELGQPVEYDNVIVEGDLDLSGLNLTKMKVKREGIQSKDHWLPKNETLVSSPIAIINSKIFDVIDFKSTRFQEDILFSGTVFEGPVIMRGSNFYKLSEFDDTTFNNSTCFYNSYFNRAASFGYSKFNLDACFEHAMFNSAVDFTGVAFNDTATFYEALFNGKCLFWFAQFNKTADFNSANFNKNTTFGWSHFNDTAEFNDARFYGLAIFGKTTFSQTPEFSSSRFDQVADFTESRFWQGAVFKETNFLHGLFNNSQFSQDPLFEGARINGTLSLYRTKYDTLNIRWSSIHDLAYDDTAYHLLIQNFNKLGFTDDASECQYSYRCKHREELFRQHKFDRWLFDLLAYATYGYGLRPVRPLGWSFSFILIGGLFFVLTGSVIRSKESPSGKRPLALRRREEKPDGEVSIWEALLLSATYFTSGASSIISATPTEFVPLGRGRYVVVLLRLLGWIFFVIFLSSLTRTV